MCSCIVVFFPVEEQERQERNRSRQSPEDSAESSAQLDFMLALSLQNEGQASGMVEQGFWESVSEADPARRGPTSLGDMKGKFASFAQSLQFCLFMGVLLARMSVSHVHPVPWVARGGCWIP